MKIYSKTDTGTVRSSNQDSFLAGELSNDAVFGIVCDGMGGANAGNVASETAVKIISDYIIHSYRAGMDEFEAEKMLKNAIESANIEIFNMASNDGKLSGMGTTAVIALVQDNKVIYANVGDSRIYIADDEIVQLTRDHSVVQSLLESGKITFEDAKVHPRKNVITRALGTEETIIADTAITNIKEGQTLLLCSDGLTGYAEEKDILKLIKENPADIVCDKLVELAVAGGGGDNITVITLVC